MPWSEFVTYVFKVTNKFPENGTEYNGPFNVLLPTLLPPSEHYQVAPQFKYIASENREARVYFVVFHINKGRHVPVMLLEPNTYGAYDSDNARKAADNRMRERIFELTGGSIPIPKLYGICALGTRICVYEYTVASHSLTPPLITSPNNELAADVAPKER